MFINVIILSIGVGFLFLFLNYRDKNSSILAIKLKAATSICFILVGITSLIVHLINGGNSIATYILIICGLLCGLAGDILLDLKAYYKNKDIVLHDRYTFLGMGIFGVGHVFYILALVLYNPDIMNLAYLGIAIGLAIVGMAIVMSFGVFMMKMKYGKFFILSTVYGGILSVVIAYSFITTIVYHTRGLGMMLAGSILFMVSDLILSMTYFSRPESYEIEGWKNPESKVMIVVNHSVYYMAQFIIALAILVL